jgi:hypothetical protein
MITVILLNVALNLNTINLTLYLQRHIPTYLSIYIFIRIIDFIQFLLVIFLSWWVSNLHNQIYFTYTEENSEKIGKIWKKSMLNSEMIWKIWKKCKLNSEKIWKLWITILLTCCSFVIDVYVNVWYFHNVFRFVCVCNVFCVEFQRYGCCCCSEVGTKSVNNWKTVKTVMTLTWYRHF